VISGKRIQLRRFVLDDLDFLLRWNNDPAYTGEFEPFETVTQKELKEWLLREKPGQLWYVILADGERVGQVVGRVQDDGSIQVGYRLVPSARGRGYATDAVLALSRRLFAEGVPRITAEVNPKNIATLKVLERAGFRRVGYKERAINIDGVWLDGLIYELTRDG
jgi:ribosomal-protein-alanine N-acetyltransferase